jgi:uncharacterized protein YgbK (DUF1537 family)
MLMDVLLGAIADDFTGASDLASILVAQGMCVTQIIGEPRGTLDVGDAQAVVVALKSRTEPVKDAVASSVKALHGSKSLGARFH